MRRYFRADPKEVPCSGKIDPQYLFHALEGGAQGICIVTCPEGKCTLAQGNYRARVRVHTVRKLLEEMGQDGSRVDLIHCNEDDSAETVAETVRISVSKLAAMASNPVLS